MILSYLRSRAKVIVFGLVCCAVIAVVFFLYHLPLEPVLYAFVLCAVLGVLVAFVDHHEFVKRRARLGSLIGDIAITTEGLPEAADDVERDYQALVTALQRSVQQINDERDHMTREMLDYYTLWVHQIKTPIAAMRLLIQAGGDIDQQALAAELFKVEGYVSMVLSYMRLESDATDFVFEPMPLEPVVKRAVRKYARLFILKKLGVQLGDINQTVLSDSKWLSFAIEQVISNAVKYTQTGGVRIYENGRSLVIEDTGMGIRQEDLPRVFDRGYTGSMGRVDGRSTGIGLYLTKRILTMLRHTIDISVLEEGGVRVVIGFDREAVEHE